MTAPSDVALWRRLSAYLGCAFVGGMLLIAGLLKALDPAAFAEQIAADVPFLAWAMHPLAVAGVLVEVVLGSALLLGFRRRWILGASMALVVLFVLVTVPKLGDEDAASCGCFGNFAVRTPGEALAEDAAMLAGLLVGLVGGFGSGWNTWRRTVLGAAALTGLALPLAAPALPLDNFATRLKPGAVLVDLQLDEAIPDLMSGRHVVMLADQPLDACGEVPEDLYTFTEANPEIRFWLARPSDVLARDGSMWLCVPGTELVELPAQVARPLYRTLPRSFEMVDGIVIRTWEGFPSGS